MSPFLLPLYICLLSCTSRPRKRIFHLVATSCKGHLKQAVVEVSNSQQKLKYRRSEKVFHVTLPFNWVLFFSCKLIPIVYRSFLCTISYLWVFFMYQAFYIYGYILCIAPPILYKMLPIYRVSYVLFYGSILSTPIIVGSYSCT